MSFWSRNIDSKGRALRGLAAAALFGAAAALFWQGLPVTAVCAAACGLFCAYEAARGWCFLRACGLKTRF